jgi:hypothetical protein
MKFPRIATTILSLAFILGARVEQCFAVTPPILLNINDTDPTAVTITATGFPPIVDSSGKPASSGVDLLAFFFGNESSLFGHTLPNSTLIGGNSAATFQDLRADNFSQGGDTFNDLILFLDSDAPGAGNLQTFSTLNPAFSGTWTINFTSLGVNPSALPTAGTIGDILSGNSGDQGSVIGQWQVVPVPEPGIGSLVILASLAGLAFRRRRTA